MKFTCPVVVKANSWLETPSWLILKEVVVALLAHLFLIQVFLLTAPFLLYRKLVARIAKMMDKDVTGIVSGLSAMFHRDFDCYHTKSLHSIVACLRVKRGSSLTLSGLQQAFLEKVVRKKGRDGKLAYPELQQHYTRFMGYSFLKWDRKFDIENHVTAYTNESDEDNEQFVVTHSDLMDIWQDLMDKGFPKQRSPWEAILVENYAGDDGRRGEGVDWIIFMRIHHGIVDGFCFEKIISSLFESDYVPNFTTKKVRGGNGEVGAVPTTRVPSQKTLSEIEKVAVKVRCLLLGPYDLFNRSIRFAEDYHCLHLPANDKCHRYFVVESPLIPVEHLKRIKRALGLGFTTILVGIVTGGIRNFLMRNSISFPERYTMTIPFPSPEKRRGDNLGNDFLFGGLDVPIHEADQRTRLRQVEQSLEKLRSSSFMKMLHIFLNQLTNLPSSLLRAVTSKSIFSVTYSSIPGPDKIITSGTLGGGADLIEANFTHGLSSDSLGLGISSITFGGNVRMTVFVDRGLVGGRREKAEQLVDYLFQEYNQLLNSIETR